MMVGARHTILILVLGVIVGIIKPKQAAEINLVGKTATQSSTFEDKNTIERLKSVASNAVDGKVNPNFDAKSCTHTAPIYDTSSTDYPWWTVDMGDKYVVESVTVYNRDGSQERLSKFYVKVGDSSNRSTQKQCAFHDGIVPVSSSAEIKCTPKVAGRYITIERTTITYNGVLTLCEVKASGYKYIECQTNSFLLTELAGCKPCNCKAPCDKVTGKCTDGCKAGKQGDNCQQDCANGQWGEGCQKSCNCEQQSEVCTKETGACRTSGCKTGYTDTGCDKELPRPPPKPVARNVDNKMSRSLEVEWRQWQSSDRGQGPPTSYKIQYRVDTGSTWTDGGTKTHTANGQYTRQVVNGLEPSTTYHFRLIPTLQSADGLPSPDSNPAKTSCEAPVKPVIQSVNATEKNSDGTVIKIQVTWQALSSLGHHCNSYTQLEVIYSFNQDLSNGRSYGVNTMTDTTATFTTDSDYRGTRYYVAVRVKNDGGLFSSDTSTVGALTTTTTRTTTIKPTPVTVPEVTSSQNPGGTTPKSTQEGNTGKGGTGQPQTGIYVGVGVVAVVLLVVIIVAAILLMRWKKRQDPSGKKALLRPTIERVDEPPRKMFASANGKDNQAFEPEPNTSASVEIEMEEEPTSNAQPTAPVKPPSTPRSEKPKQLDPNPIPVPQLAAYVENKKETPKSFTDEFKAIPNGLTASCEVGSQPENIKKNRFQNIRAYDHSRVKLDKLEGDPHSDYVNACYVDGYKMPRAYVASQGATKVMMDDLWRVVWQDNSNRLVMVTNLVEGGKRKCEQYWPDMGSQAYGEITVHLLSAEKFADFVIRSFSVSRKGETRKVHQFHFTAWPDHGVPQYATSLIAFQKKVRSFDSASTGPIVVHCSAGVGRTGTFIGLDCLLDQAAAEDKVDIYTCICNLRKARTNMVQTLEQYTFIHEALLEALQSGDTAIPCTEFPEKYKELCEENAETGISKLQQQFQVLGGCKPKLKPKDIAVALQPQNKNKNRNKDIVPASHFRPYLTSRVEGSNDYINAVYIDGFKEKDAFIMTQMPLPNTIVDLWRMISDHRSCSIVFLDQLDDADKTAPCYWPVSKEEPLEFDPIKVEFQKEETLTPSLVVREFKVTNSKKEKDDGLRVKQFHVQDWLKGEAVPASPSTLLTLLSEGLESWQQQTNNRPITVMCHDGAGRSGVLCVISSVLEKMKLDQEVDIFHMVKQVRIHRPAVIGNLEQYKFCHQAALDFMDQFQQYANFR